MNFWRVWSLAEPASESGWHLAEPDCRDRQQRRRITADTALRLSLYFGNSPEFWLNLQTPYDLKLARQNLKPRDVKRIKALRAA